MVLFNPQQTPSPQQPQPQFSNGGTVAEFALNVTPTTILPDRDTAKNRRGLMVFNKGTANALFSHGTTVSANIYTAEILPGGYFEDSSAFPWQGPVVARARNSPTNINVTELIII